MNLSRTFLWRKLRERRILAAHKRTALICKDLIAGYKGSPEHYTLGPKKAFDTDRIIWQYWAQGYDNVPPVVRECLDSVEQHAKGYCLIRLTDENLDEYLEIPEFVKAKRQLYSKAHFSDLLRLMLLKTYGGLWLDATVFLSGPIPKEITDSQFFVYRRDQAEENYKYWRNKYAYYFGWARGFRVNMLNSIMSAKKGDMMVSELCELMLVWWKHNDSVPDYFFFQILFDVYPGKEIFPLVSDTLPHYLQQSMSDPGFNIMPREEIVKRIPIHKLTYKK